MHQVSLYFVLLTKDRESVMEEQLGPDLRQPPGYHRVEEGVLG